VVADQKLFKQLREVDDMYRALIRYVDIAEKFGLDTSEENAYLVRQLSDGAANRSIFLEIALDDVAMLRSTIATLPGNENLVYWMSATQTRIQMTARALQKVVELMNSVDLETRQDRRLLGHLLGHHKNGQTPLRRGGHFNTIPATRCSCHRAEVVDLQLAPDGQNSHEAGHEPLPPGCVGFLFHNDFLAIFHRAPT